MQIAIAMIVKNEESCLARCLDSVKGLGDIYIVDTGSTDKTVEIAKQYTPYVFANEYKWNDSMCEARNYVLDKCTSNYVKDYIPKADWILSIDADEYLEPNSFAKIHNAILFAERDGYKSIQVILEGEGTKSRHYFPRIFKKGVRWKGAIHNYLDVAEDNKSDIKITYGYSEAHKKDPDRAFRILTKESQKPESIRELFYLAREYWYRKDFVNAIDWYKKYLLKAYWGPEMADANLMIAKCYWRLGNAQDANRYALEAIRINNDFKEAIEFIADLSGPKNSERWLYMAYCAKNQDVLFVNEGEECNSSYYNSIYKEDNTQRYTEIYKCVGNVIDQIKIKSITDLGCGSGELQKHINCDYIGVDFCEPAIKFAEQKGKAICLKRDIYEYVENGNIKTYEDINKRDTYVLLEVLEHIDDLKLFNLMEKDTRIIASVPSFADKSHLRRYTKKIIEERYKDIMTIDFVERFNLDKGIWMRNNNPTVDHITLFGGIKL